MVLFIQDKYAIAWLDMCGDYDNLYYSCGKQKLKERRGKDEMDMDYNDDTCRVLSLS